MLNPREKKYIRSCSKFEQIKFELEIDSCALQHFNNIDANCPMISRERYS